MEKKDQDKTKRKKTPITSTTSQTVRFISLIAGLEIVFTQENWLFSLVRRNEKNLSIL